MPSGTLLAWTCCRLGLPLCSCLSPASTPLRAPGSRNALPSRLCLPRPFLLRRRQDCPYKHNLDEIKECNMYRLGFCIYGPACRFKHVKLPGPPPPVETVEAAKPREHRNMSIVSRVAYLDSKKRKKDKGALINEDHRSTWIAFRRAMMRRARQPRFLRLHTSCLTGSAPQQPAHAAAMPITAEASLADGLKHGLLRCL
jgi:hypothetical protein